MTKPKRQKREPKRWLLWCTISDTPFEGEEYLSEQQLRENILLDLVVGVRTGPLRFQLLPDRKKSSKRAPLGAVGPKNPLDNTPSGG